MKRLSQSISLIGVILILLVGMAMTGCTVMGPSGHMANSLNYVRQHKGEGLRRAMAGSEVELMDAAVKIMEKAAIYTIAREPHAVLAEATKVDLSYAFYFYPSQTNSQTEVEVLIASPWLRAEQMRSFQEQAFSTFFVSAAPAPVPAALPVPAPAIKSDVDELPSAITKQNKNSYAIIIGIENYRQKLPKADFAAHDAQIITEYLTKVMGYPEENVVTLINDRALKSDFEKYFEKWLSNNVEKDGSVFIYYSGHGAPNPKTGDAYLVPYDGDPSFIDQTGYSLKRLYDSLGKLQAKEIIVALDSCFSGAGGRSVIAKGARPLVMSMESYTLPSKLAVLSAASGDQISSTYEEKGHGLFTYFMLKGIKGEGDINGDGKIEIGELFDYIKPQVERIARKTYNNEQSPQLIVPNEKQKILLRN